MLIMAVGVVLLFILLTMGNLGIWDMLYGLVVEYGIELVEIFDIL